MTAGSGITPGTDPNLLARAIAARGSSPWERISGQGFAPGPTDPAILADRQRAWIAAAAGGDGGAFARLLARRGIAEHDWRHALADAVVDRPGAMPSWANTLAGLVEDLPEEVDDPALGPLAPFRRIARRDLAALVQGLEPAIGGFGPDAFDGLVVWLERRLLAATASSFRAEARLRATMAGPAIAWSATANTKPSAWGKAAVYRLSGSRSAWLQRFQRQPAMARMLAVALADWRVAAGELLGRLAADRAAIAQTFFNGEDAGAVTAIEYGTGDPHRGGRSVAIVALERGRVVYKPKDLRAAAALGRMLARLAESGDAPDLVCPTLLLRPDHAWERWVSPQPCRDAADVERFYGRLGAWTRVLQLLGAVDFWFDNLIAHGDRPVFVDFETMMSPPPAPFDGDTPELAQRITDSPVWSGVLPWLMPTGPGSDPSDLGCFARPGEHRTSIRRRSEDPAISSGDAKIAPSGASRISADGMVAWTEDRYAAFLDGAWADPAEHMDVFRQGYAAMHGRLAAKPGTAIVHQMLAESADAPLRFLLIDTWTCYRLIEHGTAAGVLSDGVRREIALESLWERYPDFPGPVGDGIIDDLRRLDVPLLECRPGDRMLATASGRTAPDYFAGTAMDAVRRRLERLDRTLAPGMAAIATALSTRPDRPLRPVVRRTIGPSRGGSPRDAALDIGRTILDGWDAAGRDPLGWPGLVFAPAFGCRFFGPLPGDVLSGTAGIAMFLGELHRATAMPGAAECARALGAELASPPGETAWSQGGYGAAVGLGARVRALLALARCLDDGHWLDRAVDLVNSLGSSPDLLPADPAEPTSGHAAPIALDWVGGFAGLLCVLASLAPHASETARAAASRIMTVVRARGSRPIATVAPASWALGLHRLPGAAEGWRLAARAWPDLIARSDLAALTTAHPAEPNGPGVGNLRTRLVVAGAELPADQMEQLVLAIRHGAAGLPDGDRTSGVMDRLQLALTAARYRPALRADAGLLADTLIRRRAELGAWFADEWASEEHRLSAVDGIVAVARAMLRLVD